MKKRVFVLAILAMACLAPSIASAAPITYIDPVIGVRGLDPGFSAGIKDSSPQPFSTAECNGQLPTGYICSDYIINDASFAGGIFSITLRFLLDGIGVAFESLFVDGLSQFGNAQSVEGDPTAIRLSADGAPLTCGFTGGEIEIEAVVVPRPCTVGDDLAIFISPVNRPDGTFTVQALAVNDVQNPPPVPEPGTLLLMGTGVAAVMSRVRRKAQ